MTKEAYPCMCGDFYCTLHVATYGGGDCEMYIKPSYQRTWGQRLKGAWLMLTGRPLGDSVWGIVLQHGDNERLADMLSRAYTPAPTPEDEAMDRVMDRYRENDYEELTKEN